MFNEEKQTTQQLLDLPNPIAANGTATTLTGSMIEEFTSNYELTEMEVGRLHWVLENFDPGEHVAELQEEIKNLMAERRLRAKPLLSDEMIDRFCKLVEADKTKFVPLDVE